MANRKRDVQILLWVNPEEKKMIRKSNSKIYGYSGFSDSTFLV